MAENQLKHLIARLRNVNHAVKPGIPVSHSIPQGYSGNNGKRNGNHDPEHDLDIICAVNLGGLLQFIGNSHKKVAHNRQIIGAAKPGQDHGPEAVIKSKALHEKIARNQSSGKKHGKYNEAGP